MTEKKEKRWKKHKKYSPPLLYLLPLGVVAALLLAFSLSYMWKKAEPQADVEYDKRAEKTEEAEKSAIETQISGQMDETGKKYGIHFRIYSEVNFPEGSEKPGETIIQNSPDSRAVIRVEIVLNETGKAVFVSEKLKEGESLYKISLTEKLKAGTYDAAARIHVYDREGKKESGGFSAGMKLKVLK